MNFPNLLVLLSIIITLPFIDEGKILSLRSGQSTPSMIPTQLEKSEQFLPNQHVREVSPLWQNVSAGVEYREFYLSTPNLLYVARLDRANPQITLESSLAQGRLSGGLETVREQAARYEQAIGYWGESWGTRNHVVVAINGSFYDPETGVPWSGLIHSGWYAKRFEDRQNASGFAWTLGRQAFIGGCIMHRAEKQLVTFMASERVQSFDGVNVLREKDELILYTPQYGTSTATGDGGIEVLVELSRPLMIMPTPEMIVGVVRDIRDGQGATQIPFDSVVLSATGKAAESLRENVAIGEKVGISQEIRHLQPDCRAPNPASWTKTYASVSSGFTFLANGVIQGTDDLGAVLRNPRTAIAFNHRYIFFIVVDGRDRLRSLGMSMVELANFAKNTLGAVWGAALDGGGSSTMVVNGELKNRPNAELTEQGIQQGLTSIEDGGVKLAKHVGAARIVERAVANGMMMVVVQPRQLSSRYESGDQVVISATGEVNLRLGPGTNYAVRTVLTPGSQGEILAHPLNGVLAKDMFWWKIRSGDTEGWISEEFLISGLEP